MKNNYTYTIISDFLDTGIYLHGCEFMGDMICESIIIYIKEME